MFRKKNIFKYMEINVIGDIIIISKFIGGAMQENSEINKLEKNIEYPNEIDCKTISERSSLLIEQLKEKLEYCEKRAVQRINELDLILTQEGLEGRVQGEIRLWQEKYKVKQKLKKENLRSKIIDKLINWSI
jgi:predicted transcriptional regulator of viral defense system